MPKTKPQSTIHGFFFIIAICKFLLFVDFHELKVEIARYIPIVM